MSERVLCLLNPLTYVRYYNGFVRAHADLTDTVEDTLLKLTQLLPERYGDAEVTTEGIDALIGLIMLYHDAVIGRAVNRCGAPRIENNADSTTVRFSKAALAVIKTTEHVAEAVLNLRRFKQRRKWRILCAVESAKAVLRVVLLMANGGRMLTQETDEEVAATMALRDVRADDDFADLRRMYIVRQNDNFTNTMGQALDVPKNVPSSTADIACATSEVLHILRPVIYTWLVSKFSLKSWRPWLIALGVDVIARALRGDVRKLPPRERQELRRRVVQMLCYILREPFFSAVAKRRLLLVVRLLAKLPLLGVFFWNQHELLDSLPDHYFYTSAS
ncbi:MAG: hypothetical protein MHM6MM_006849 [Cercozoa sp. M6MM]